MSSQGAVVEPEVIAPEARKNQEGIALRYSSEADADLAMCGTITVETEEQYHAAGETRLALDVKVKKSEAARDALVRPLNDHVRWINSIFKPAQEKWKEGMRLLSVARLGFERVKEEEARRERERLEKIARDEQARIDRLALERAQRAEARGNTERAEEILSSVPQIPIPPPVMEPPVAKTTGVAKTEFFWAEVTDLAALVTAVAAGEVPLEAIQANTAWLDRTAKALRKSMRYPGVTVRSEWRERSTGR